MVEPKENETPVELVICVRDLAEKWLKDCGNRQAALDAVVKEQCVEVLPDEVRVWVKEWKPRTSEEAGNWQKITGKPGKVSCGPQHPQRQGGRLAICVDK